MTPSVTARSERYSVTLGLARISDSRSRRAFSEDARASTGLPRAREHVSHLAVTPRQVVPDLGDRGIGLGECFQRVTGLLVRHQRLGRPAGIPEQSTDLGVAVCELLANCRDGGVILDQLLKNRACRLKRLFGLGRSSDRMQRVADRIVASRRPGGEIPRLSDIHVPAIRKWNVPSRTTKPPLPAALPSTPGSRSRPRSPPGLLRNPAIAGKLETERLTQSQCIAIPGHGLRGTTGRGEQVSYQVFAFCHVGSDITSRSSSAAHSLHEVARFLVGGHGLVGMASLVLESTQCHETLTDRSLRTKVSGCLARQLPVSAPVRGGTAPAPRSWNRSCQSVPPGLHRPALAFAASGDLAGP